MRLHPWLIAALPSLVAASLHCKIVKDGVNFDMTALKGAHSVTVEKETLPTISNTTWTINPCGPLKKSKEEDPKKQCPNGTQVCGIERIYNDADMMIAKVIPVAGDFGGSRHVDETVTRLRKSESHQDDGLEGLRVVLHGGLYEKRKQEAIVEFLCDPTRTGLEGNEAEDDGGEDSKAMGKREEDGDKKEKEKKESSLQFVSYTRRDDNTEVLRLTWKTKYACENAVGDGDSGNGNPSGSWGFFTWFIIILFLGVAAYLIFGSWLNYNRYGARGWDLLPHGDTIRDVPYLLKDWGRRVMMTLQGGSGRGGYSAV